MWEPVIRETSTLVALKDGQEGVRRPVSAGTERGREMLSPLARAGNVGTKDGDSQLPSLVTQAAHSLGVLSLRVYMTQETHILFQGTHGWVCDT